MDSDAFRRQEHDQRKTFLKTGCIQETKRVPLRFSSHEMGQQSLSDRVQI